jgi:hypothetical protein
MNKCDFAIVLSVVAVLAMFSHAPADGHRGVA